VEWSGVIDGEWSDFDGEWSDFDGEWSEMKYILKL
jgi:hypothetical protein